MGKLRPTQIPSLPSSTVGVRHVIFGLKYRTSEPYSTEHWYATFVPWNVQYLGGQSDCTALNSSKLWSRGWEEILYRLGSLQGGIDIVIRIQWGALVMYGVRHYTLTVLKCHFVLRIPPNVSQSQQFYFAQNSEYFSDPPVHFKRNMASFQNLQIFKTVFRGNLSSLHSLIMDPFLLLHRSTNSSFAQARQFARLT